MDMGKSGLENGFNVKYLILAIIAVGAVFAGYQVYSHRSSSPQIFKTEQERLASLRAIDLKILNTPSAIETDVFAALIRLAQQGNPIAQEEALKRMTSPSATVRAGVANSLGYFDDSRALPALEQLLRDSDLSVRTHSLYALGHKLTPNRAPTVERFLKSPQITDTEKVAAFSTLLKLGSASGTPRAQAPWIKKLVDLVKQTQDFSVRLQGALILSREAARDPQVTELFRGFLHKEKTQPFPSMAIRQLAGVQDPWFIKNFSSYYASEEIQNRIAAIQTLHLVCPKGRWEMLRGSLAKETDQTLLREAMEETLRMPGKAAMATLLEVEKQNNLKGEAAERLKKVLGELGQKSPADPCNG